MCLEKHSKLVENKKCWYLDWISISTPPQQNKYVMGLTKYEIEKEKMIIILSWLKSKTDFNRSLGESSFEWTTLLKELAYSTDTNPVYIEDMDKIMVSAIEMYDVLKKLDLKKTIRESAITSMLPSDLIQQEIEKLSQYTNIIDELMLTYKFENSQVILKQEKILKEKLELFIKNEEYEKCSEIQKILTELK